MKCQIHGAEMDWVPMDDLMAYPDGGFWFCDLCQIEDDRDDFIPLEEDENDYCPHCGKEYEDFSDLGCGYCDKRSPDWDLCHL